MMLLVLKQHSMWPFCHIYISKSVNTWKRSGRPWWLCPFTVLPSLAFC